MKRVYWKTRITETKPDAIMVRGYDIQELIGRISFGELFYLLVRGELPSKEAGIMVEDMLVSCSDHGIITTSVVARYAAASGTPLQGALAAGLLTIGDVYGGAVEQAAHYLHDMRECGLDDEELAAVITQDVDQNGKVPGFGHPLHPDGDPRSFRLLERARELGVAGEVVRITEVIEQVLRDKKGRFIPLNADGALAALALDMGFEWRMSRAFMLLSRAAGILAHSIEEVSDGTLWRRPPPAEHDGKLYDAYYEGVPPRGLPSSYGTSGHQNE